MSTDLETVLSKIEKLEKDELLTVLKRVAEHLQPNGKDSPKINSNTQNGQASSKTYQLPEGWQTMLGKNGLPMYGKWGNIGPGHPEWSTFPGSYTPTPVEVEADLAEMFTPEERAAIAKVDLDNIPEPPIPLSQSLNEDREDRF